MCTPVLVDAMRISTHKELQEFLFLMETRTKPLIDSMTDELYKFCFLALYDVTDAVFSPETIGAIAWKVDVFLIDKESIPWKTPLKIVP
jgi:hypothetical protein